MRNKNKTIYVVGGTNGVGKSALYRSGLLKRDIPYFNADFVAKEIANGRTVTNDHYKIADDLCNARIKKLITAGHSFAFENNMHEEANYKWLKEIQQSDGYRIELMYVGVEDLKITTARIQERLKSGEHYVPADQVMDRYEKGMKLLEKYSDMPDQLTLIDNSDKPFMCYQLEKGQKIYQSENLPDWAKQYAASIEVKNTLSLETMNNIGEMKESLEEMKKEAQELKNSLTNAPAEELKRPTRQIPQLEQKPKLIQKRKPGKRNGLQP